ncbi:MAG TPA: dsDNA nuclease domain-containing protein [Acidobacteriaceae bacterium]|nr:dsDNA nuclease domain-containing protein [Acidobacteriaceae bacterium]
MGTKSAPKVNASNPSTPPKVFFSVEDATPSEEGGPIARTGFNYQDEIAVGYLLDMLEDPSILKVHCETHDDIILVSQSSSTQVVAEYVQVKGSEEDKYWSVADLCVKVKGKAGTSIYETSLERDKHCEQSRFRIVTLRPANQDLKILTYDREASNRKGDSPKTTELISAIEEKCNDAKSEKGNGADFWVRNCLWDERQSEEQNRQLNLLRVIKITSKEGRTLLPEQAETILQELRKKAKDAGDAKWAEGKDKKIIERAHLREWWNARVQVLIDGSSSISGGKLEVKMASAQLPEPIIELAKELRRDYAAVSRTSKYSSSGEDETLRSRVKSTVQSLQSSLYSGELNLNGKEFHSLCLTRMDQINEGLPEGTPDRSAFLKGCMYDIADRCLLRFERSNS